MAVADLGEEGEAADLAPWPLALLGPGLEQSFRSNTKLTRGVLQACSGIIPKLGGLPV